METAFTVGQAFAISGVVIAGLLGIIGHMVTWMLKGIKSDIQGLAEADSSVRTAVTLLKDSLPKDYVMRRDFESSQMHMATALEGLKLSIHDGLERIYDKLDKKQDKD